MRKVIDESYGYFFDSNGNLNLGCKINRVAVVPPFAKVDLFVPRNAAPDMSKAIMYAQMVLPEVTTINVLEEPNDTLSMAYRFQGHAEGGWQAFVPQRV